MHGTTYLLAGRGSAGLVLCALLLAACSQGKSHQGRAEQITDAAMASHPGEPAAGAQAALEALQHEFKTAIPAGSQQRTAAIAFAGYYSKNVYAIGAACAESGVQLPSYSAALAELNAAPFQAAGRYVDVPAVMAAGRESDLVAARRELHQIAVHQKSDLKHVCGAIEENSREVASAATFSRAMPEVYSILMDGA